MTEHLFKLKKDGKTVGYLEIRLNTPYGYPVLWFRNLNRLDEGREWHSGNNIQGDSLHPFVTQDKHGKDVFARDKVSWRPKDLDELCEEEILEAGVKGGFFIFDVEGTDFVEASKFKNEFELIEEKDNEEHNP